MNPFKIGDKIRCIDNYGWSDCLTKNKVYEVLGTVTNGRVDITGDNHTMLCVKSRRFELVEERCTRFVQGVFTEGDYFKQFKLNPKDELQDLIDTYNAGIDAYAGIWNNHIDEVRVVNSSIPTLAGMAYRGALGNKLEKIPQPTFEPFYVGYPEQIGYLPGDNRAKPWKVELKGDRLHVGCKDFSAKHAKKWLFNLTKNNTNIGHLNHNLLATRSGIKYNKYMISWEDADKILEALEKAGVK